MLVLAALILSSCRGANLDDLTRRLRCGMSVGEVRLMVLASGADELHAYPGIPVLYGTQRTGRGRARLYLGFDRDRLAWFRDGQLRGWTGMHVGMKHDLCSGRLLGSLVLSANTRWERATVLMDGQQIAMLPPAPNVFLEIDVPAGQHSLLITKPHAQSFSQEVSTDEDTGGVVRVDLR